MAIFTILYGNYYPPHGELKLICIGKFARRTWMNFSQQYGKNRRRYRKNKFYYAAWHLLLYFYREIPSKILSVYRFFIICFINGWKYEKVATNWDRVTNWCVYLTPRSNISIDLDKWEHMPKIIIFSNIRTALL